MDRKSPPWKLISAYLDDELPPKRRRAFERMLAEHPEWQREVDAMRSLTNAAASLRLKSPDPKIWDNYWEEIDARLPRQVSWVLMLVGAVILMAAGVVWIFVHAQNGYVRFGIVLILLGFALMFGLVLRGRLLEIPRDRYRKINR